MPKINNRGVRELRRTQAEERQNKYSALTIEQKLEKISSRPGESKRERTRISQ